MRCQDPDCAADIPDHARVCIVCGRDAGFPNRRAAELPPEKQALRERLEQVRVTCEAGGCGVIFRELVEALKGTRAVITMSLSRLQMVVSSDRELYTTFHRQVDAAARLPEDNHWDKARESVGSAVFPNYHEDIIFGALSLTGAGHSAFGPAAITLRDVAIRERASVFDEPLFPFFRHHGLTTGDPLPVGHRAVWQERHHLAAAKIGPLLTAATKPEQFQELLLPLTRETEGDCIEVHIYGPLHQLAFAHVAAKQPERRADRLLLQVIQGRLTESGVSVELGQ
jgi:hypothetical protein